MALARCAATDICTVKVNCHNSCKLQSPNVHAMQIVAYDFGCKNNILRRLASFGCKVTVVPADYPAQKVMELNPDGIFLSNGPVSFLPKNREVQYIIFIYIYILYVYQVNIRLGVQH